MNTDSHESNPNLDAFCKTTASRFFQTCFLLRDKLTVHLPLVAEMEKSFFSEILALAFLRMSDRIASIALTKAVTAITLENGAAK